MKTVETTHRESERERPDTQQVSIETREWRHENCAARERERENQREKGMSLSDSA